MIKTITAGIAAAGITVAAFALPAQAGTRVNWQERTCSAFTAWERHPTTARLDAMTADSFHVPWKYLGADAADLYRAVRSGRDTSTAVQYFYEDCHNGSGL